jgi:cytochrome c peroxidase
MGRFGRRSPTAAAYASFSPKFHYDKEEQMYVGGSFWDGRAATLADQAKMPFLDTSEMNNPSGRAVVEKVRRSGYAVLFRQVYGPTPSRMRTRPTIASPTPSRRTRAPTR